MGLLTWLQELFTTEPAREFEAPRYDPEIYSTYNLEAVGESHYQRALEKVCGGRTCDGAQFKTTARLVAEDDNPHDDQAVRVDIDGMTVGYLSRDNARMMRRRWTEDRQPPGQAACPAIVLGGWDRGGGDRGAFGVRLDLRRPKAARPKKR